MTDALNVRSGRFRGQDWTVSVLYTNGYRSNPLYVADGRAFMNGSNCATGGEHNRSPSNASTVTVKGDPLIGAGGYESTLR